MATSPYAAAPAEKLDEIIRLAESRLAAQLTIGIAADQRAMTMTAVFGSVTAALLAAFTTTDGAGGLPFAVLILGFAVATILAAWTALPIGWEIQGNEPSSWLSDIPTGDSLHNCKAAMAEYYDDMIAGNDRQLKGGATLLQASFVVAILMLLFAGGAAFIKAFG